MLYFCKAKHFFLFRIWHESIYTAPILNIKNYDSEQLESRQGLVKTPYTFTRYVSIITPVARYSRNGFIFCLFFYGLNLGWN